MLLLQYISSLLRYSVAKAKPYHHKSPHTLISGHQVCPIWGRLFLHYQVCCRRLFLHYIIEPVSQTLGIARAGLPTDIVQGRTYVQWPTNRGKGKCSKRKCEDGPHEHRRVRGVMG